MFEIIIYIAIGIAIGYFGRPPIDRALGR